MGAVLGEDQLSQLREECGGDPVLLQFEMPLDRDGLTGRFNFLTEDSQFVLDGDGGRPWRAPSRRQIDPPACGDDRHVEHNVGLSTLEHRKGWRHRSRGENHRAGVGSEGEGDVRVESHIGNITIRPR